jgi:hypothetical protein
VHEAVKSIMNAAVADETCGSMFISSMIGCITIPPPTPSIPAPSRALSPRPAARGGRRRGTAPAMMPAPTQIAGYFTTLASFQTTSPSAYSYFLRAWEETR